MEAGGLRHRLPVVRHIVLLHGPATALAAPAPPQDPTRPLRRPTRLAHFKPVEPADLHPSVVMSARPPRRSGASGLTPVHDLIR